MATKIDAEAEKKEILKRYRALIKACRPDTTLKDKRFIRRAFNLAVDAHKDMRRKTGEPYIYHPLAVAHIVVKEIGLGTTAAACSLLHDVVEDTDYTLEDMDRLFGSKVASIIDGLTKISGIFDLNTDSLQAENFKKMLLTLSDDVRVILIKLADRLHNMRTLDAMPSHKQLKIASETLFLFAPLSHRLGLYAIKSELQDLSLKYTEKEVFNTISHKIQQEEKERDKLIAEFASPIEKKLKDQGFEFEIFGRSKSIYSIWEKMKRQEIPFEEVYDLLAVRIIISSTREKEKTDCWRVYSIVTDYYRPNPDRLRDWVSMPKANGYEALHTTVMSQYGKWVEVQIRTARMDEIAEKGYAAHWKYKEEIQGESGLDKWLKKIRELLQGSDTNALDFIDDFKLNLFSDEIFLFTPKGELRTLPAYSTALDFAYGVHSQVGNHAIGAKVNNNLVPLNCKLKSGDQVEIITSGKQKPNEEWYKLVVTARAKSNIKAAIRAERKKVAAAGEFKLKEILEKNKIEFNKDYVEKLKVFFNIEETAELFVKIEDEQIKENEIKLYINDSDKANWLNYIKRTISKPVGAIIKNKVVSESETNKVVVDKPDVVLLGDKMKKIKYFYASCCTKIPGDEVIGLLTNEGIEIHRTNCDNAIQLMSKFGNKIVKAKWFGGGDDLAFLTGVKFSGIDKVGMIRDISQVVCEKGDVNIRSINFTTNDGVFDGIITLYVLDTKHLNDLMKDLRRIDGVRKVFRVHST